MPIDSLSLVTTPVALKYQGDVLSFGTGFYYVTKIDGIDTAFLVTNYHVVTGNTPGSVAAPEGDSITIYVHASNTNPSDVRYITIPLYTKTGRPTWMQHATHSVADIVLFPIPDALFEGTILVSVGGMNSQMIIRPTTTVTLIGYPRLFHDHRNCLPVWKTGSIASEPGIDFDGEPKFMVDVSAFSGMSGSPVFAISYGTYEHVDGTTHAGYSRQFLGIFSAMAMIEQDLEIQDESGEIIDDLIVVGPSQLGFVWKAHLIAEIAQSLNRLDYETNILGNF